MNLAGSELPTRPIGEIESEIQGALGEGQSFAYSRPVPEKYRVAQNYAEQVLRISHTPQIVYKVAI